MTVRVIAHGQLNIQLDGRTRMPLGTVCQTMGGAGGRIVAVNPRNGSYWGMFAEDFHSFETV